jgi:Domain of unknown function (DUF4760)
MMADGDNKRWWRQTKSAVAAWWHRSGWKTIATVAVPLAITFGVIAGIQRVELQDHHLQIDPTGPNWADIVTALSTSVLAVAALLALAAIVESRRARNALQMTELSRRWDEEINQQVRQKVHDYAKNGLPRRLLRSPMRFGVGGWSTATPGPARLKECIMKLQEENDPEYRQLLTEPNFLEDLAILIQRHGIDFGIVNQSLGSAIAYRWSLWKPTVDELRKLKKEPRTFTEFEELARRIAKKNPRSVKVDAAGRIIWDEFRD